MTAAATAIESYQCPYCDQEYTDERLVRTHISLSDDSAHAGRNGVMQESTVYALDADSEIVEELNGSGTISGENMDEEVPDDVFPASTTEKQLLVLKTAVRNPNVDSLKEIERRVTELYDTDVSYQTVRNTVQDFFVSEEDDEDESETYEDLTPKQRAVVDVMASKQNESTTTIAEDIVGVSKTYPSKIEREYGHVIEGRDSIIAEMPAPEWNDEQRAVIEELKNEADPLEPEQTYDEIAEEAGVDIDVVSRLLHGHKHDVLDRLPTEVTDDDDVVRGEQATDSSITSQAYPMSASPEDAEESNSTGESKRQEQLKSQKDVGGVEHTEASEQSHIASQLQSFLELVQSHKEVAQREVEYSDGENENAVGRLVMAESIEQKTKELLGIEDTSELGVVVENES